MAVYYFSQFIASVQIYYGGRGTDRPTTICIACNTCLRNPISTLIEDS